jgi:acetyl esterase/lipase
MKNRHLLRFQLKQQPWDWNTSIPEFREQCEKGAQMSKMPAGVEVLPVTIEGLPAGLAAEWLIPEHEQAGQVIFYTHGGGYVSGSCSDHRSLVARVAKESGVRTLLFEYRLAPEHPYPAALEDTLTAYRWLLSQEIAPANILIMGESAGGGLCLAALLAIRDQGLPLPSAGIALSPWTDLKLTGDSYRTKAKVCMSPEGMSRVCTKYYAGENDPGLPWISPLYGDLHGLPPLLIYVGEYETLLDDSTRFAAKAEADAVDVTLRVGETMVHCYPLLAPLFPEATHALAEIGRFIKTHIGKEVEMTAATI